MTQNSSSSSTIFNPNTMIYPNDPLLRARIQTEIRTSGGYSPTLERYLEEQKKSPKAGPYMPLANMGYTDADFRSISCADLIQQVSYKMTVGTAITLGQSSPNYPIISEYVFRWFVANGAKFLRIPEGDIFMYYKNVSYRMKQTDMDLKAMMHRETGLPSTGTPLKLVIRTVTNLAYASGVIRDSRSWNYCDINNFTIYISLNNPKDEIVKISPGKVEVHKNGDNPDGVFLRNPTKASPIRYNENADMFKGMKMLNDIVTSNLMCNKADAEFLTLWYSCFPLIGFSGTRPHGRFQGSHGSGKTTASKLMSTFIFGAPQQKIATIAANYSDAESNPMVLLDNVESDNIDKHLRDFILTVCTQITRETVKPGTLNETIRKESCCLVNTTGIEPFKPELMEIMTRTFIFNFDIAYGDNKYFSESAAVQKVKDNRDYILSALFKKCAVVLEWMSMSYHEILHRKLHRVMGEYSKQRCKEYFVLMYMMHRANHGSLDGYRIDRPGAMDPAFIEMLESQEQINLELVLDSNIIAGCLHGLFADYCNAKYHVIQSNGADPDEFEQNKKLSFKKIGLNMYKIENVTGQDLHSAMKTYSKKNSIEYKYKYASQLGQRLLGSVQILAEVGLTLDIKRGSGNRKLYTITMKSGAYFPLTRVSNPLTSWDEA